MVKKEIAKVYEPKKVEEKWYRFWESKGYFHAEIKPNKKPFCVVIPPPNVTGSLHIGHALNNVLQDIVVRKKRMEGFPTLWLPGTDHAGIATQNVVEQQLASEGLSRQQLGREKFLQRAWEWKEKYGRTIINQLKKLGCSCDWDRERFTMDEGCSKAVREVFVRLYKEGLIYRGKYIVNWCPRCRTALSDIEVEHRDVEGGLYYIKYFFKDSDEFLIVATTRPETLLGDTAVAVSPKDKRYRKHVGRTVILPVLGREIPVIKDDYIDPDFGTGVLKVTPGHDPYDFEIGKRHQLPVVNIFTPEAKLNENAGPKYKGTDRYEAREAIVKELEETGLLIKTEPHHHAVGHCYRCDTVVEPSVSPQWFVKMKPLAKPAIKAVKQGKVTFIPKRWDKVYFKWMGSIKDWCISRQLWWGHRIPVWYCKSCDEIIVEMEAPRACPKCGSNSLKQDEDVLDTWFSSALWPFSTLGWPEKTDDLAYFYPTSLLVTSHDIIYFWVARMIMMGLHFADDIPFSEVYIHALIRDAQGQKMSKSKGNVIDPLEIINAYGTDALRFTLGALATPGRDVYLSEERIEGYRNFANKIWNASRFVLMNLEDFEPPSEPKYTLADRWILSRYNRLIGQVEKAFRAYNFSQAAKYLYDFFWGEFCDWYVELCKKRLYQKEDLVAKRTAQAVLVFVLDNSLRLLHPFMPFITEEIWQKLPDSKESIVVASWPKADKQALSKEVEEEMRLIQDVTCAVRSIRSQSSIPPSRKIKALVRTFDKDKLELLRKNADYISELAGLMGLTLGEKLERPSGSVMAVERGVEVFVPLAGLDLARGRNRLEKEIAGVERELERVKAKLSSKNFVQKAPAEIVQKQRDIQLNLQEEASKLREQLKVLGNEKA